MSEPYTTEEKVYSALLGGILGWVLTWVVIIVWVIPMGVR